MFIFECLQLNVLVVIVCIIHLLIAYCIGTFPCNYGINHTDQCITKKVLHVYTMDTCSVLCCNNKSNSPISQFNSPCNAFTSF